MTPRPSIPSETLRRGLTLLELLIVITILAILTTVASRSMLSVSEQAQYDANDNLGRDFRKALIGSPNALQSDGTPSISGLIADLGRPPRAELETYTVGENEAAASPSGQAYTLRELVSQRAAPAFGLYKPDITLVTHTNKNLGVTNLAYYDTTNTIATGWRGPYMQGGADDIIDDSWAKPVAAYSAVSQRSLVNLWNTSYLNTTLSPPSSTMMPFTGVSLNGYHNVGDSFTGNNYPTEVVGVVIRPGAASTAVTGSSLSLAAYTNSLNAGLVWTNEYVATLQCSLTLYTNRMTDTSFTTVTNANYWYMGGIIMYGPNPLYNSVTAASSPTYANSRPVGVAYYATATAIASTGLTGGTTLSLTSANAFSCTNYPLQYLSGAPGYSYPLVHGPKVVKPFLVAVRKSTAPTTSTSVALFTGPAINLTLRPGFNSVQLSVP